MANVNPFDQDNWTDVCEENFDTHTTPIVKDGNGDITIGDHTYSRGCRTENVQNAGKAIVSDGFAIKDEEGNVWETKAFDKVVHAIFPVGRGVAQQNNAERILKEKSDHVISSQPFEENRLTAISSSTDETAGDNSVLSNLINNGVVRRYDGFADLSAEEKAKWLVKDDDSFKPATRFNDIPDDRILYNKYRIFATDDHQTRVNAPPYNFNESYIIDKYNLQGKLIK